jgi:hypothetical protein
MAADQLEPVSPEVVFLKLRDHLRALEAAFEGGVGDAEEILNLWERTRQLKVECDQFYQFLSNYESVLNGLLWAHYPDEYRDIVYPRLQESEFSDGLANGGESSLQGARSKGMLAVAEEVFLSRGNDPLSIPDLILQMKGRAVTFKAKDPAKSLAQAMRNSGRFETASRGMYRLKTNSEV